MLEVRKVSFIHNVGHKIRKVVIGDASIKICLSQNRICSKVCTSTVNMISIFFPRKLVERKMASGSVKSVSVSSSPKSSSSSNKDIESMKLIPYPLTDSRNFLFYWTKRVSKLDLGCHMVGSLQLGTW